MTLDIAKVIGQIGDLASQTQTDAPAWVESLERAHEAILAADSPTLRSRVEAADKRFAWHDRGLAGIVENISARHAPPHVQADFTVLATDGSHIEPERHHLASCFLINIGAASIRYGEHPSAELTSEPTLSFGDDMVLPLTNVGVRREPLEGALLGMQRSAAEAEALATLAEKAQGDDAMLAMLDGTLVLWGAFSKEALTNILKGKLLPAFQRLRQVGQRRPLGLASYISHPGSSEVVNALRLQLCPFETIDCEFKCGKGRRKTEERECLPLDRTLDRHVFERHLAVGERSATFRSLVSVVQENYGEHEVRFFYLRLEEEVARVEIPRWVAEDAELLGLTHALILDQCRRGLGYPVALSEAHEQAVLTGADRDIFWQMVESSLAEAHLPVRTSGKSRSKRRPWL